MTRIDQTTLLEWLDADADGSLAEAHREALDRALVARPELTEERQGFVRLHRLLAGDRIPVRAGFVQRVLDALPAGPEAERSAWRLPVALATVLAVAAGVLLAVSAPLTDGGLGTIAAIADFFAAAALAGAGLLGATWQGVTLAFDELLVGSRSSLVALILGVLFLDLLFLRLLRRRPRHARADRTADSGRR